MKLLTKALESILPDLGFTENLGDDAIAKVKFFTPDSNWTWYVTEYNKTDRMCFGLVVGLETELGYFSLTELESARGPMGLKIERDLWFKPTAIGDLR